MRGEGPQLGEHNVSGLWTELRRVPSGEARRVSGESITMSGDYVMTNGSITQQPGWHEPSDRAAVKCKKLVQSTSSLIVLDFFFHEP
jgi:hypothetical protein